MAKITKRTTLMQVAAIVSDALQMRELQQPYRVAQLFPYTQTTNINPRISILSLRRRSMI